MDVPVGSTMTYGYETNRAAAPSNSLQIAKGQYAWNGWKI